MEVNNMSGFSEDLGESKRREIVKTLRRAARVINDSMVFTSTDFLCDSGNTSRATNYLQDLLNYLTII